MHEATYMKDVMQLYIWSPSIQITYFKINRTKTYNSKQVLMIMQEDTKKSSFKCVRKRWTE